MGRLRIYGIKFISVFLILSCLSGLNGFAENTAETVSVTANDSSGLDTVESGVPITYNDINFLSGGAYTLKVYAQTKTTANRKVFISIDGGEKITLQIEGSKNSVFENSYDIEFSILEGEHDITLSTEDSKYIKVSKIEFTLKNGESDNPPSSEEPTGPSESVTINTGKNSPEITLINPNQYNGESAIILNTGRSVEFTPNIKSGQCEITVFASNWNYGAKPTVTNLTNGETASFTIVKTGDTSGTAEARNFTASATVNIVNGNVLRISDGGNDWKLFSVTVKRVGNFSLKDNTQVNFSAYSEKNNVAYQDGYIVLNDGGSISFVYDCESINTYLMKLDIQGESGASIGAKINGKEVYSFTLENDEATEISTDAFLVPSSEITLVLYSKNGNIRINKAAFSQYVPQKELEKQIVKLSKTSSDIEFGPEVSPYTGDNYVLFTSDNTYVTFKSLLKSGNYKLSVKGGNSATFNRSIKIQNMSDETVYTFTITPDATLSNQKIFEYASEIYINSGDEFKIYGGDGGVGLSQLTLTYIPDNLKLLSVYTGEYYLDVLDKVNRSSDTVTIYFNNLVDEASVKENILVVDTDNNKNLSYDFSVSENKVDLYLKDTLEFGCNYEIKISDLKSLNNKFAEITSKQFVTSSTDDTQKNAVIKAEEFSLDYGKGTLEGEILGSHAQSISGRNVQVYVYPDNLPDQKVLIHSQKSDEKGKFKCDIDLESLTLPCKKYDFMIKTEYSDSFIIEDKAYVSKEFEEQVFSDLKKTQTESETEKFLTQDYKDYFTFDAKKDAEQLSNKTAFYKQFIGLDFKGAILDFEKYYQKILLYSQLNTTNDGDFVKSVITDIEKCNLLGVDYKLISLIVDNKEGFISDLIAMPDAETLAGYITGFNDVLIENYKKETNKTDSTPVVSQKQVALGQGIAIPLKLSSSVSDLKKITFVVESSEVKLLENNNFISSLKSTVNKKLDTNKLTVEMTFDEKLNNIDDFGVLNLTAALAGSYNFSICGEVLYSVGGYEVKTEITKTSFNVIVIPTSIHQGAGSAGTTSSGGRPSVSASTSSSSQVEEPSDSDKIQEEQKVYFNDIEGVSWAEESINELTDRNIISRNDTMQFRPYDYITREEFVKLIVCTLSLKNTSGNVLFEDMDKNAWYCSYISAAVNSGIINGYNEKEFGIGNCITREDLATIIYRVVEKLGYEISPENTEDFLDGDLVSSYAKDAVNIVKSMGIINGVGNNMYMPKSFATRAQCAKIIYELIKAVGI